MLKLIPPGARKGNKAWLVRGHVDGRLLEVSSGTTDRESAERFAAEVERKIRDRQHEAGLRWSVSAAAARLVLPLDALRKLPTARVEIGLYFLFDATGLIYVGQSCRITKRIIRHGEEGRIAFIKATRLACSEDDLDLLEAAYVRHYQPRLNRGLDGGRKTRLRKRVFGECVGESDHEVGDIN